MLAVLACAGTAVASSSQPVLHFNPGLAPLRDVDAATSGPFVFLAGNDGSCTPFAVGTRWLEFAVQCRRCQTSYMFQNLRTGVVSTHGNSGRFITSLDAASPVRRVCPTLSVPKSGQYWPEGRGAVAAYGQNVYVLPCGSHRGVLLAENAGKVVGSSSSGDLDDLVWHRHERGISSELAAVHGVAASRIWRDRVNLAHHHPYLRVEHVPDAHDLGRESSTPAQPSP